MGSMAKKIHMDSSKRSQDSESAKIFLDYSKALQECNRWFQVETISKKFLLISNYDNFVFLFYFFFWKKPSVVFISV